MATNQQTRRTNLLSVVTKADPDFERLRSRETEYEFPIVPPSVLVRLFVGNTPRRGPYADE